MHFVTEATTPMHARLRGPRSCPQVWAARSAWAHRIQASAAGICGLEGGSRCALIGSRAHAAPTIGPC
jgi:hypothetical protein